MAFDGIAVAVIVKELKNKLINSRVMKVYQPDSSTLLFHLRSFGQTHKLLLSSHPIYARIHTTQANYPNPQNPPAFCMLLRKYLEPSRILDIEQYQMERIVTITFETFEPEGHNHKHLIFELMGRDSNIIFVDQDYTILDALRRTKFEQQNRNINPGVTYQLPPVQMKLNPLTLNENEFKDEIRFLPAHVPIYRGLIQLLQGLGQEAAKEICYRAGLDPSATRAELSLEQLPKLWKSLQQLLALNESPILLSNGQGFSAYQLTGVETYQVFTDLDTLLDIYYTSRVSSETLQQEVAHLQKILKAQLKRIERKEQIQRETLKEALEAEKWQKMGELILANIHQIPKGAAQATVIDYYEIEQPQITIQLDPSLSASQNAQNFFKKYAKAKKSEKITQQQLENTVTERMYIEQVMFQLEHVDNIETLTEIREELITQGIVPAKPENQRNKRKPAKTVPFSQYITSDGHVVLLGRSNRQNDELTFKVARSQDIWLHARNVPGSHVILKASQPISKQALLEAATLAALHSRNNTMDKVEVDYTERKHVHKPPGAKPGYVIYDNFKTVLVNPHDTNNHPQPIKADQNT